MQYNKKKVSNVGDLKTVIKPLKLRKRRQPDFFNAKIEEKVVKEFLDRNKPIPQNKTYTIITTSLNATQTKKVQRSGLKILNQFSFENSNQILLAPQLTCLPRVPKVLTALAYSIPIIDFHWAS